MKLLFLNLVGFLPLLALADDVLDFSDQTSDGFKESLRDVDVALVEFFAPWCGHCKRLAPEYAKAASILKSSDHSVPLVKVDCTSESGGKDLCNEYGVSGYPTLKIFKKGEFAQEYQGPRDADGIAKYMKAQAGPASTSHASFKSLNDALRKAKEVVVVGIFESESSDDAKRFLKTADRLREKVNFAHVTTDSASDSLSALEHLKDLSLSVPAVVLVRPSVLANKFEPSAVVYKDGALDDFITKNYHGLVQHRTQDNAQEIQAPYVVVYYDVDYVKNPKGTNYWRNRVLKVAQNHKDFTFAIANGQSFAHELEEFGLEAPKEGKDTVPVVAARDAESKKYVLKAKFGVEELEKFVKDVKEGKLEPYIKSEEVPSDNSGPVKTAVAKNIDELVLKSEKDVLIEFYAPWCGHCKKLAPTWEEVGTALKDEPNVEIVKMDATANDVPPAFVVTGFPTIYWYPADTKEPKRYEGGREKNDFIKFIAKQASKELQGYDRSGKPKKKTDKEEL